MNSQSQIFFTYNYSSFDNYNSDNEKTHYTLTNSMIHNFLNAQKMMDYDDFLLTCNSH